MRGAGRVNLLLAIMKNGGEQLTLTERRTILYLFLDFFVTAIVLRKKILESIVFTAVAKPS